MTPVRRPRRFALTLSTIAWGCVASILLAAPGCDDGRGDIRTYTVPKEAASPEAMAASTGTTALTGDLVWTLPEGWRSVTNTNAMRFATIEAGAGDDQIEIAISRLAGGAGGVVPNVNRWRGQVGLPPTSEEAIAAEAMLIQARGARALVVDLDGPESRMLAAIIPAAQETWFIKTTATSPAIETHKHQFIHLCESVSFSGTSAPPREEKPGWPSLPDGWTADATPAAMSVASITVVSADDQAASLTITSLGGQQDWLANVNRWRRQLGLPPVTNIDEAAPEVIDVAGAPGMLVDIEGDGERTLGVIVERGTTWFFKLAGPDPLVADQRPAFETFIRSLSFQE